MRKNLFSHFHLFLGILLLCVATPSESQAAWGLTGLPANWSGDGTGVGSLITASTPGTSATWSAWGNNSNGITGLSSGALSITHQDGNLSSIPFWGGSNQITATYDINVTGGTLDLARNGAAFSFNNLSTGISEIRVKMTTSELITWPGVTQSAPRGNGKTLGIAMAQGTGPTGTNLTFNLGGIHHVSSIATGGDPVFTSGANPLTTNTMVMNNTAVGNGWTPATANVAGGATTATGTLGIPNNGNFVLFHGFDTNGLDSSNNPGIGWGNGTGRPVDLDTVIQEAEQHYFNMFEWVITPPTATFDSSTQFTFSVAGGQFSFDPSIVVPEPSRAALILTALGAVFIRRNRIRSPQRNC